jgi:hypothetical protein
MCYSAEASTYAFFMNAIGCLLLSQTDPALGAFFFFVGLMQLFDLVFWLNQSNLSKTNWIATKSAMITNHLQPVVLACLLVYLKGISLSINTKTLLLAYIICVTIYSINAWYLTSHTLVTNKSYPSLYWEWNDLPGSSIVYSLFLVCLVAMCYEGFESPVNLVMSIFAVASFFLSAYYYKGRTAVGRFWCYFASYAPILLLAIIKAF